MKHAVLRAAALTFVLFAVQASAANWLKVVEKSAQEIGDHSSTVQHNGTIEYAFSPHEGAERLVLKVIDSARSEIRMMTYSLTSAQVVRALIAARHRGVDVAIVSDYKSNVAEDKSGKARAALSALVNAGCRVRTISLYPIHHDKVIIVDRETVETGSFNYSDAAAGKNSENVMVIWRNTELAKGYLEHWNRRFSHGEDYQIRY
ncbi:phospholipase D family protein [Sulfuricystis multivorans]|uniref:phospholipase D family nuclease n=1 Tax=Sulfuricystis multivorans TaxID=2211108 RepID=UPI000F846CE8|nr:phospholipase D family protein [Sulfuricystis multivorans]